MDVSMNTLPTEVRKNLTSWEETHGEWLEEAEDSFAMVAGDQWDDDDLERMGDRPAVTMNRVAAMVRGVCGLEVSQRMEARYLGREMGDTVAAEMDNAVARWVREGCNAEDEESDAFRDMLVGGLGWTETRVDYDTDPEGQIVIERIDPMDVRWDPSAGKRGLADRRWCARIKRMATEDVKRQWPDKADEIDAYVANEDLRRSTPTSQRQVEEDEVEVVQYQYFVHRYFVRLQVPMSPQPIEMTEERAAKIAERIPVQVVSRVKRRTYRQAVVCGAVLLEDVELRTNFFTINVMTGFRDRNQGIWYGLVRDLKDPQRWSNKFYSTIIDIMATNAKGGLMAETGAVENPRKFEEEWSNPRKVTWLKPGGLGKVQDRPPPAIPPQLAGMMEFAIGSMPQISGINLEFLGMADRNQPGVLEYHRKQAVASSLAELFAALRQYRKTQGVVLLEMIKTYVPSGRLVRITGPQGEAYVPYMKGHEVKYDVVVDEAATAPDRKMQTWLALQELLPMAMQAGLPVPPSVLDYSPLPQSLAQEWKKLVAETPRVPPQVQKQLEQLQKENAQLKDKTQERQAQMAMQAQEQQGKQAAQAAELQMDRERQMMEIQMERERAAAEMRLERERAEASMQLEREKAANQIRLAHEKAILEASVKETVGLAQAQQQFAFERTEGRISGVADGQGRRYQVDRDAAGNLIGLRAITQ